MTALVPLNPQGSPVTTPESGVPNPMFGRWLAFVNSLVASVLSSSQVPLASVPDALAKAWVEFDNTGSILAGFNVTSVTKNATGDFTVNFTNAFASANYACVATLRQSAISNGVVEISHGTAPSASAIRLLCDSLGGTLFDPDSVNVVCYGR